MTERDDEMTPTELRAREALRELQAPPADPAFRARLKAGFSAGTLVPGRGEIVRGPWFARPLAWGPLAAAAALAIVLGVMNRAPDWRVVGSAGEGNVIVNGRAIPLADRAGIAAELRRGGRVQVPAGGSLELVSPGQLAVSFAPESDARLPAAPNRWWGRAARAEITMGDLFFETGARFHGASLDVHTAEVTAHVVGTTFAVLRQPHGTCVCVMEGRVRVRNAQIANDEVEVTAGKRRMCYDDAPSETGTILDYSSHHLHRLRADTVALLGR